MWADKDDRDVATDLPPAVFPGDAADAAQITGASPVAKAEAARHGWKVLAVLSALMGFASISTDLYLPAMPTMGRDLLAAHGQMEWTVSGYLVGFAIGQLFWGPVGDRYGRRLPIAAGVLLFILGSAGCALAQSIPLLIAARVLQALGACASVVLARAMVRDLYQGNRAAQMMSTLMMVMGIAPLLGPLVGGQILLLSGWRAIFWFLVGFGALTLAALFTLPETLDPKRRSRLPLKDSFAAYWRLLRNRRVVAYAGAGGFFYAAIFAYIAGSPHAYIEYYHVSPRLYGLLFGLGILGVIGANFINARIVGRFGGDRLMLIGAASVAVFGLILAFNAATDFGGLAGLVIPLFAFASANGLIVANSITGALDGQPHQAGAVSALVGTAQYGSGIFSSALVGIFANGTPLPMGAVMAVCGIGTLICARLAQAQKSKVLLNTI